MATEERFEAPGLHDEHHEEHGHEPTAKLDPKSAKKLAKGHKEEIVLAVIGIIVAIYLYMRSSSSSSSASPSPATTSSPAPTGSGTGSGGGSSGPGPSGQGYGSQNNTLLQEILGYLQNLPSTTPSPPGSTTPVPTTTTPAPVTATQTYPSGGPTNPSGYTSYGTKSPYTKTQIAQNSPGPSENPTQAANNAAWAKADGTSSKAPVVVTSTVHPGSGMAPTSYRTPSPVSVYHPSPSGGGGAGSGAPAATTRTPVRPVTTSRISVGHNYLRP